MHTTELTLGMQLNHKALASHEIDFNKLSRSFFVRCSISPAKAGAKRNVALDEYLHGDHLIHHDAVQVQEADHRGHLDVGPVVLKWGGQDSSLEG